MARDRPISAHAVFVEHPGGAEFVEGDVNRFVGGVGVSVLSEIASKSPCSFPMISTTACDFASSRVNRCVLRP